MGRFSPTVTPTWGQSLSHALEGGVGTFLAMRRQKLEDEKDMYGHGLQAVDPNAPQPAASPAPQAPPAASVGDVSLAGPEGAQALAGGPPPNFKGRPKAGQPAVDPQTLAAALANHVQGGHTLQTPEQAQQPSPQQVGQALDPYSQPVHLMGRDWVMTPQARAQMTIANALRMAEIRQKDAETAKNQHEAVRLQPGDPGYVENMGAVAGAEANAKLPADLQRMVAEHQLSFADASRLAAQRGGIESGLVAQRGQIEQGLQTGSQTFQQGQQGRQQTFEAGQQATRLAGEQTNRIAAIDYTQGGQLVPSIVRGGKRMLSDGRPSPGSSPLPGTSQTALPPLTAAQTARAASDPAYKAFLATKGYK